MCFVGVSLHGRRVLSLEDRYCKNDATFMFSLGDRGDYGGRGGGWGGGGGGWGGGGGRWGGGGGRRDAYGSRDGGYGGGGGGGGGRNPPPNKVLFVRNLSYDTDSRALQDVFYDAVDIYLPKDRETGERRG